MRLSLWRWELRHLGLPALAAQIAVPLALVAAGGLMTAAGVRYDLRQLWLGGCLEMAAPLIAALPVAWIVALDPVLELQLSVPTVYSGTVMRRLALVTGLPALSCFAVVGALWATGWWRLPVGFWPAQLAWLSPLLWLLAAAALSVLVVRSPFAASGLLTVVWLLQIIAVGAFLSNPWLQRIHLFATTFAGAGTPVWWSNRLGLAALAVLMVAATWRLLHRSEALLSAADDI